MTGKFSLKSTDFEHNVTKTFKSLRTEDEFCDVTLVSSDKKQVSAHKVVLSSYSDYFRTILKNNNKTSSIVLCLENIYFEELNQVLDYVYNGEVKVEEDQLEKFVKIGQRYQLEGISEYKVEPEESTNRSAVIEEEKIHSLCKFENTEDELKTSTVSPKGHIIVNHERFYSVEELDEKIKEYIFKISGSGAKKFGCTICNQLSRDVTDAKNHVEVHFDGLCFPCQVCGKTFRNRNTLKFHKNSNHGKKSNS